MKTPSDLKGFRRWHDEVGKDDHSPSPDAWIITSAGQKIPAHSSVLASASTVLERKIDRPLKHGSRDRVIPILGVPCGAVVAFVGFLYSSGSTQVIRSAEAAEAIANYGLHLLVLSHAYRVGWLKRMCETALPSQISAEDGSVIDMLKLSRQCDAPRLYLRCMRLVTKEFHSVQQSESWRFVRNHDPRLELDILQFIQDADQRRKRRRRERAEQEIYGQLNEAMECLEHICTEGCTDVGPHDVGERRKRPCARFRTCEGLQLLIRHFATCGSKKLGCVHCKRMWQLFRLHSSICHLSSCKVPFCEQFKLRVEIGCKGDEVTWRLLVRKVVTARVMSSLVAQRKRPERYARPPSQINF